MNTTERLLSLAELGELLAKSGTRGRKRLSDQARMTLVRDALAAWHKPCPFRRGDVVIPANHSTTWKPEIGPCIVSQVYLDPTERFDKESRRFIGSDMRVLSADENGIVAEIEAHSRDFETWTPATTERA